MTTNGNGNGKGRLLRMPPDRTGATNYSLYELTDAIIASQGLVMTAAAKLGCQRKTLYNYLRRFPALRETLQTQRELRVDRAERSLDDAVAAGEAWAVAFTLKTLGKNRGYTEKT